MKQFTNHKTSGDDCRESGEGETMREQFETWTKMFGGKPDLTRANGGANYADSFIDIAWLAWKASRAAIEISMPPRVITAEIGPAVSLEKMMARLAVNGIKVKSDEQRNPTPS